MPVRKALPFKDQRSVHSQLADLSHKIATDICPNYMSRKIGSEIKQREEKPPIVNQQHVVYHFQCDLCSTDYVSLTCRHLHQRIGWHKGSVIGNHLRERCKREPQDRNFKLNLIYKLLFTKDKTPKLNKQSDLIWAKPFV